MNIKDKQILQFALSDILRKQGFLFKSKLLSGSFYENPDNNNGLIIDINICNSNRLQYIEYTDEQNSLMNQYSKLYRFSIQKKDEIEAIINELCMFVSQEPDIETFKKYGVNRQEQAIDPSLPEATFEELFSQVYGESSLYALEREAEYYDYEGKRRFIDYVLKTKSGNIAIELNGEQFHHPAAIKQKKYASQLFKQNSLVADGYKVYRWSQRGMADKEKFILQIKDFFGSGKNFNKTPHFKSLRSLSTFTLAQHQKDALDYISGLRSSGRNTFIIVMPTATGKTEIFIKDYFRQWEKDNNYKALVMVPRAKLKQQTIERFQKRYPQLKVGEKFVYEDIINQDVCVQTYSYVMRNYHKTAEETYQYLVVDEAHHAQANGLKKVLEFFRPENLIGFTATDQRLDQKNLEDIFGQYETQMTLKEAIEKELVPPVSVYRLKTNIDFSKVRFNGKDFVKSDLQKTIQIPSRDEMIVELLKDGFSKPLIDGQALKQGIIFCVDIKHAKRMAQLLNLNNIKAKAVSGKNRTASDKALKDYKEQEIQFLCACDLLNEGWDSPQTAILVMARPTMSKVLYTQQLGRGTRLCKDKERLYVIDVVDSYGAMLQPWSVHGLLDIKQYAPFADILNPLSSNRPKELLSLAGLYEREIKLEPIDLFSLREQYSDMLSEEQLARELFISTGTIRHWIKKGDIKADVQLPFGKRKLYFFSNNSLNEIRIKKSLKEHSRETRKTDFYEFLEKRDYTFSYKIIFLCLMFKLSNNRGEVDLSSLTNEYTDFYNLIRITFNKADKDASPLNKKEFLDNKMGVQRSILQNPFEKFERKRFMYHCNDLNFISFDPYLWQRMNVDDKLKIQSQMFSDLENYYTKLDIKITDEIKTKLQFINTEPEQDTNKIVSIEKYFSDMPQENEKFYDYLPYYPIEIAAGHFIESDVYNEPETWLNLKMLNLSKKYTSDYFISRIHGHSMEPTISNGSYCLFKYGVVGTRNGRIVLAQKTGYEDPETHASFTIKRYYSEKSASYDALLTHLKIELRPDNPDYPVLKIDEESADDFKIIAEFIREIKLDK